MDLEDKLFGQKSGLFIQNNDPWVNQTKFQEKEELTMEEIKGYMKILPYFATNSLKKAANGLLTEVTDEQLQHRLTQWYNTPIVVEKEEIDPTHNDKKKRNHE